MQRLNSRPRIVYTAVGAFIAWFGVLGQLYLVLLHPKHSIINTLLQFFSYFTILTNLIVAFTFSVLIFKSQSALKSFLSKPATLTATGVYIFVVGLIYNFVLRPLWSPEGLQRIVDEVLHVVVPIFYLVYWFLFISKKELQWKDAVIWLIYPAVYSLLILIHGHVTEFYPYPFINVTQLGYGQVLYNTALIMVLFLLISLLFIGAGRLSRKE